MQTLIQLILFLSPGASKTFWRRPVSATDDSMTTLHPSSKPPQLPFQSFRLETMANRKGRNNMQQSNLWEILPGPQGVSIIWSWMMQLKPWRPKVSFAAKKTAKKSQPRLQHEKFKCRVSSPIQVKSVNQSMSTIINLWIYMALKNATKIKNICQVSILVRKSMNF